MGKEQNKLLESIWAHISLGIESRVGVFLSNKSALAYSLTAQYETELDSVRSVI